jgi:hypothetical protein
MSHLAQSETVATSGAVVDTDNLKEMHALLQGIDLRELLELAHNVEDDALSENGGQPQTLSSIYYFLFSKTGTVG